MCVFFFLSFIIRMHSFISHLSQSKAQFRHDARKICNLKPRTDAIAIAIAILIAFIKSKLLARFFLPFLSFVLFSGIVNLYVWASVAYAYWMHSALHFVMSKTMSNSYYLTIIFVFSVRTEASQLPALYIVLL